MTRSRRRRPDTGVRELPADFWDQHAKGMESWQANGHTYYKVTGPLVSQLHINEFLYQEGATPVYLRVRNMTGRTAELEKRIRDYSHSKNNVWGITARNREQNFALNTLMDPDIDFITLLGQAGTGKTLLTLAAGLAQVLEKKILLGNHHDPRHRAGGRGYRLPARHRRGK